MLGSLLLAATVEGGADLSAQALSKHLAQGEDEGNEEEDTDRGDDRGVGRRQRLHTVGRKKGQSVAVLSTEGVEGERDKTNRCATYLPKWE